MHPRLQVTYEGGTPTPAPSRYDWIVKQDAPLGYLRLNETANTFAGDSMPNGQFYGTYRGSYTLGQPAVIGRSTDPAVLFRNASTDGKVVLDGYYAYLQSSFAVETWVNAPTISGLDVLTSRAWGTSGGWRLLLTRTTAGAQLQLQIQKGTAVTTWPLPSRPAGSTPSAATTAPQCGSLSLTRSA